MPTFDYPKSQIHPAQHAVIRELADKAEATKVIEIGSWLGESASIWANAIKHRPGAKVFCVDWFKGNENTSLENAAKENHIYTIFKNNMVELGLSDYVQVFYMDSSDAATFVKDGSIDIVYIDATHDYKSVKRDIRAWYPKVREGGIICGHDFEEFGWDERYINQDVHEHKHHGVIKAVTETFPAFNVKERIWWTHKWQNGPELNLQ